MSYENNLEYITPKQQDKLDDLLDNNSNFYAIDVDELHELEKEFFNNIGGLTYDRAQEIISYLLENKVSTDLDQQFDNINFK